MAVFFIRSTDLQGGIVSISPPLSLHLLKSLRVQPGDTIVLGDERRRRYMATVSRVGKQQLVGEVTESQAGPDPEIPLITLAQSLLKSDKMNWVIQKATELGVAQIVPLLTRRVVPRLSSAQAAHHQERWQRIALEAAQQSERWDIPNVTSVQSLTSLCAIKRSHEPSLILVERASGESLSTIALLPDGAERLTLLIGPEGGWTEEELTEAGKAGFEKISFGDRILRAETAAIGALAILQSRLGHLE